MATSHDKGPDIRLHRLDYDTICDSFVWFFWGGRAQTRGFAVIRTCLLAIFCTLLSGLPGAAAQDSCDNSTTSILRIEIIDMNAENPAVTTLSLADLKALDGAGFTTSTIWTDGPQTFSGLWMSTLLREFGVLQGQITLHALNDYNVTVPASTFAEGGALLATMRNGKPMAPRGKGPLWVVWNYDAHPEFRTESIYALSIWQLDRITISR